MEFCHRYFGSLDCEQIDPEVDRPDVLETFRFLLLLSLLVSLALLRQSVTIVLYLVLKKLLTKFAETSRTNGKSLGFRAFALVHNVSLCLFSTWTAVSVVPLTINRIRSFGALDAYCERGLWDDGLGFWGFLFYLSKTWELVDTALLIVKRREPSYLQVYHHAMTILCAYWLQASHASVMFLFVGLNASIHSIMYFYYAMATLGVRLRGKSLITTAQIVQFMVGIFLALPVFALQNGDCANSAQKFAVCAILAHAAYLTKLFSEFYSSTYKKSA
jgi:GNS1/SUR4 family